jgi:hypothetical protein
VFTYLEIRNVQIDDCCKVSNAIMVTCSVLFYTVLEKASGGYCFSFSIIYL